MCTSVANNDKTVFMPLECEITGEQNQSVTGKLPTKGNDYSKGNNALLFSSLLLPMGSCTPHWLRCMLTTDIAQFNAATFLALILT